MLHINDSPLPKKFNYLRLVEVKLNPINYVPRSDHNLLFDMVLETYKVLSSKSIEKLYKEFEVGIQKYFSNAPSSSNFSALLSKYFGDVPVPSIVNPNNNPVSEFAFEQSLDGLRKTTIVFSFVISPKLYQECDNQSLN